MTDLNELAKRVEAGEAGLPIHKEILAALGYTWRGLGYWYRDDSHQWKGLTGFTTSFDAAMLLVPEGWVVALTIYHDCATVTLSDDRVHPVRLPCVLAEAATPALALTAAALRSRAAMGEG